MKKQVLSAFAFVCLAFAGANAQTVVQFRVDADEFINNGGVMANGIVSIAGAFTDRGGDLANWSPEAGAMNDLGNNVFAKTITFTGAAVTSDSLFWKYVQGSSWADGDEGNDWPEPQDLTCTKGGFRDRKVMLPASGSWVYNSLWAACGALTPDTKLEQKLSGVQASVFPNPSSNELNVKFFSNGASVINLIDVNGRTVSSLKVAKAGIFEGKMNVAHLPKGLYKLSVIEEGRNYTSSVVLN